LNVRFNHHGQVEGLAPHKLAGEYCDGDRQVPQALESSDHLGSPKYPISIYKLCEELGIQMGDIIQGSYHENEIRLTRDLARHGMMVGRWTTGERYSFGPLSRVVDITNLKTGSTVWYMYG